MNASGVVEGSERIIIVTGAADEPDQYRRLERQLRDAATEIRVNRWREVNLQVRRDLNNMVSVEVVPLDKPLPPWLPRYVFRADEEPVAYNFCPSGDEEGAILCAECAATPRDREFPLYADDLQTMRNLEPTLCERCQKLLAEEMEKP